MIERYQDEGVKRIFGDQAKWKRWTTIEAAVCWRIEMGSQDKQSAILSFNPSTIQMENAEALTHHDVQAFLVCLEEHLRGVGFSMTDVHSRLTSSDLVDTGLALALRDAYSLLMNHVARLVGHYQRMAVLQADTVLDARTHGRVALPITGDERWKRMVSDLQSWQRNSPFQVKGKLGGPVGSSFTLPEVESFSSMMGILVETGLARQCSSRHVISSSLSRLAALAGIFEAHATNLRLWLLEGVEEYQIRRPASYVGSSSMPYKNNPTELERVCGMARLARGYGLAMAESCALWHERDISHSSVERVAIPDLHHCLFQQIKDLVSTVGALEPVPYAPRSLRKKAIMDAVKAELTSGNRATAWAVATAKHSQAL